MHKNLVRILCMHKNLVHAQDSYACTRFLIRKQTCTINRFWGGGEQEWMAVGGGRWGAGPQALLELGLCGLRGLHKLTQ